MIEIHPDGRVRFLEERNVTLETPMKLQLFPFDTQTLQARMIVFGNLSERLNVALIGILTVVAYQFLIEGSMPRIAYFTFTDTVLLYSFLVMCLSIFESLTIYSMCKAGHKAAAERVHYVARWAFPSFTSQDSWPATSTTSAVISRRRREWIQFAALKAKLAAS